MQKLIPLLFLLISLPAFAQRSGKMNDRIKAQKIAFITEKLDLTSDEATKFWPIYNAFETSRKKIKTEDLRAIKVEMRNNPHMSDSAADDLLKKLIEAENDLHDAKLKLVEDLKTAISSKKIIRLKATEDEFNRALLKRLKEMRDKREKRN
jgi:hypothetical protein